MRFVPDFMLVPLMGWLFRMRDDEGNVLWPNPLPEPAATSAPSSRPISTPWTRGRAGVDRSRL